MQSPGEQSRHGHTLRPHQHHGNLGRVPVAGQTHKVVVDGLEADLVLQAEDKHHRIHPGSELGGEGRGEERRGGERRQQNNHKRVREE